MKTLAGIIMKSRPDKYRIWELDFLRGIALLFMIYFHIVFDMKELYGYAVNYASGFNYFAGKIAGILFILLAGLSSNLSRSNMKRGLRILVIALAITIFTYFYNPDYVIVFGILHFLAACILLLFPAFKKLHPALLMLVGTAIIIAGSFINKINAPFDYLFFLGITSKNFVSSDYYPLLPWSGLFLYGMALGKTLYAEKQSIFNFELKNNIISIAGRHTLLVYVLHQPLIIAALELIKMSH